MFEKLFIFELANNHQGSVKHAKKIIDYLYNIKEKYKINAAVKLQYRNLDTFIHPDYQDGSKEAKHIGRFLSTRLNNAQIVEIVEYIKSKGFLSCVTPFDEISVDACVNHDIDIIKVASCSADDWPLLERIARVDRPIIVSTGGLVINDIDNLVSFLSHKSRDFAILHCLAMYPAPKELLNLKLIQKFCARYPENVIGYSGHEDPDDTTVQQLAVALGAQIFERHVGLAEGEITLNAYSLNPQQVGNWVKSVCDAFTMCGNSIEKDIPKEESDALKSLKRGVYAKKDLPGGSNVGRDDVFFAMPCQDNQLTSAEIGRIRTKVISSKGYSKNEAIYDKPVDLDNTSQIRRIINRVKGVLNEANIHCDKETVFEISHHYGLEKFGEYGVVLINIINRNYTKKLLVQFAGQVNPNHMHKKKEETFVVLNGSGYIQLLNKRYEMKKGDKLLIPVEQMHSFGTDEGIVYEEISSTHYRSDSYYEDDYISNLDPLIRKTIVSQSEVH